MSDKTEGDTTEPRITPDELRWMATEYAEGSSLRDLEQATGVSRATIHRALVKDGVVLRKKGGLGGAHGGGSHS